MASCLLCYALEVVGAERVTLFDAAVIGHLNLDRTISSQKQEIALGGGVYYCAIALRRLGLKVAAITKLAERDFPRLEAFKKEEIGVYASPSKDTTSTECIYPDIKNLDKREYKIYSLAEPFGAEDILEIEAKAFHITTLTKGEITPDLTFEAKRESKERSDAIKKLAEGAKISLDVQGFTRVAKGGKLEVKDWEEKAEVLAYVDFLKADVVEAELLTKKEDPKEAAKVLAGYGPKEVLITSSTGLLLYTEGEFRQYPFIQKEIRGREGRGDTCIAVYLGKRLTGNSPAQAGKSAAQLTSLKLKTPGPLPKLS